MAAWSTDQLAGLVWRLGLRNRRAVVAVAVCLAESGGNDKATGHNGPTRGCPNGSRDRGLWQINDCYHPGVSDGCAYNPTCNGHAMLSISGNGANWRPWSTYNNGRYLRFVRQATQSVYDVQRRRGGGNLQPPPAAASPAPPNTLRGAIDVAAGTVNWFLGWVRSGVVHVAEAAAGFVWDRSWGFISWLLHWVNLLRLWVHGLGLGLARLRADVRTAVRAAVRAAELWALVMLARLWLRVVALGAGITRWVRVEVWAPLRRLVDGITRWLRLTLLPWIRRRLDDLRALALGILRWARDRIAEVAGLARGLFRSLRDWAADAVGWVATWGGRVVRFFTRAAGWVEWLIGHPVGFFLRLWADLGTLAPRVIVAVVLRAVVSEGSVIEQWIARWLG